MLGIARLLLLLGLLLGASPVRCPAAAVDVPGEAQMRRIVGALRRGDTSLFKGLSDEQAARLQPYAIRYVRDPDRRVRDAVVGIAESAPTSAAVRILTVSLTDPDFDILTAAEESLLSDYDCHQRAAWGAGVLRDGLEKRADGGRDAWAILMLGCFAHDRSARTFLLSLRMSHGGGELNIGHSIIVKVNLPIDVSLAATGDAQAVARISSVIRQGRMLDLRFLLYASGFIHSPEILSQLIDVLGDARPLFNGDLWPGVPAPTIGDFAFQTLEARKPDRRIPFLVIISHHKPEEVQSAQRQLRMALRGTQSK